jgi:hypothetical protein
MNRGLRSLSISLCVIASEDGTLCQLASTLPLFDDAFSHSPSKVTSFGISAPAGFSGGARVAAISSTLKLDGMRGDEVVNGGHYSTGWIEPVLEPSAMAMVAAGSAGLLACRAWRRRPVRE